MRDWTLGPGDPLNLTLAADFRLCAPDFANEHIWELELGGGDPSALALCTTYGLRARAMRIFPRFMLGNQTVTAPGDFFFPPCLHSFFPNILRLEFSPFADIVVSAEYWIPDSHTVAGRLTVVNRGDEPLSLLLELCGQLVPMEGQSLAAVSMQSVNVLSGRSADLAPVIFLTGGPRPGSGPHPSLSLDLALAAGGSRSFTWAEAALSDPADSFELARRTAARPWEAEQARIEMTNAAQTIEVHTGDPDWDAAFAFSQKAAFSLFFDPSQHLPYPSFVLARQPDHGRSTRGDGSDYSYLWSGQSPLEAYYLASLLPGAPELAAGLVRNFLATQTDDGAVDWKPGLAGQRGRWLAAPLLASLAWQTYQRTRDTDFLREIQPGMRAFLQCWFDERHDRDRDGFPEWNHPLQTGLEDNPAFTVWAKDGQGAEISAVESPGLAAMLYREVQSQILIAEALGSSTVRGQLEEKAGELHRLIEECWEAKVNLYHNRDRDTHRSPAGKMIKSHKGGKGFTVNRVFKQPTRLLVRVELKNGATRRLEIVLHGQTGDVPVTERLENGDFQWRADLAVATGHQLYTRLDEVEVTGVDAGDRVSVKVMDFSGEDITLFLPLWAGIPTPRRAGEIVSRALFAGDRFGRPFGIPACGSAATPAEPSTDSVYQEVHLPWNALIGEGLLSYGFREEAARLTTQLMGAVIQNLKRQHAFARAYHAETGVGLGERNAVQGLAPLGLFLETLGVEIQSPQRVILEGKNPFPWPVTVKYRGLTVTRHVEQTVVVFPDGQTVTLNDPTEAIVSVD